MEKNGTQKPAKMWVSKFKISLKMRHSGNFMHFRNVDPIMLRLWNGEMLGRDNYVQDK